jgi:hypothetical protein
MEEQKTDATQSGRKPNKPATKGDLALGFAITGLVLAFLPLLNFLGLVFIVMAIVFGIVGLAQKKTGGRGKALAGLIIGLIAFFVALGMIATYGMMGNSNVNKSAPGSSNSNQTKAPTPAPKPVRQTQGTAVTIGAGTFTGGKDVAVGLYDVTTVPGASGNFMVSGANSYNEILGADSIGGVSQIRVKIGDGDKIEISGLNEVTFTPVTAAYVTDHAATTLYAGTFIVGQDVVAGRYTVTPAKGESGNFMVSGANSYNEILGDSTFPGRVSSLTVNLSEGDVISISGMNQVTFTPSN